VELHSWYKEVGKSLIRELIAVRDTIKLKEEYVLNYFINRSTYVFRTKPVHFVAECRR
jgi:hypothetical protein